MSPGILTIVLAAALNSVSANVSSAAQDPVIEWMKITNDTVLAAGTSPLFTGRQVAIVSAAVFDAVNGIAPRQYRPIHVTEKAPPHTSPDAAAIQAAYAILVKLYPTRVASLTTLRNASLSGIERTRGRSDSIQVGVEWGQAVADAIWNWRSNDGFNPNPAPTFLGAAVTGVWRPTPRPGGAPLPGAGPQIATMTPFVLLRPNQFRPPAPYASPVTGQVDLTNAQYIADYRETKLMGAFAGSPRSSDQSNLSLFWNGNTALFWIRMASDAAAARRLSLEENAHLFAMLNLAMGDAAIACWDAKYRYQLWRPITAVTVGTFEADPSWKPWLDSFPNGTPAHPEFPSGHSTLSGAARFILAQVFGDNPGMTINVTSDTFAGTRSFSTYSEALAEIHDARVFGGIHWRTACLLGSALGESVAEYVMTHAFQPHDHD